MQKSLSGFRAQDLHRRPGQRGQDDDPLPVPDERGRPHIPDHRLKRGGGRVEKYPLHNVGSGRARHAQGSVEHILFKYRGVKELLN